VLIFSLYNIIYLYNIIHVDCAFRIYYPSHTGVEAGNPLPTHVKFVYSDVRVCVSVCVCVCVDWAWGGREYGVSGYLCPVVYTVYTSCSLSARVDCSTSKFRSIKNDRLYNICHIYRQAPMVVHGPRLRWSIFTDLFSPIENYIIFPDAFEKCESVRNSRRRACDFLYIYIFFFEK